MRQFSKIAEDGIPDLSYVNDWIPDGLEMLCVFIVAVILTIARKKNSRYFFSNCNKQKIF